MYICVSTGSKVNEPSPSPEPSFPSPEPSFVWEQRLYAIGGGIDVFAGEEDVVAGEEVRTNKGERVVSWKLPDSECDWCVPDFSVANSRIFSIGFRGEGDSSIVRYLSLKSPSSSSSWVKIDGGGFPISRYYRCYGRCFRLGNRMAQVGFGGQLVRFRTPRHDLDADLDPEFFTMDPPKELDEESNPVYLASPFVVGVTKGKDRRLLMFWACRSPCDGVLGYYDLDINIKPTSWQWHMIDSDFTWPSCASNTPVFVRDKYLILFDYIDRFPGCYVYDTSTRKWLVKPIQGLSYPDIRCYAWLVELGSECQLALVWRTLNPQVDFADYVVHWVKFKLIINEETDPPTFSAENLSSDSFLCHSGSIGILTASLSLPSPQSLKRRREESEVVSP